MNGLKIIIIQMKMVYYFMEIMVMNYFLELIDLYLKVVDFG